MPHLSDYDKTVLAAVAGDAAANDKLTAGAALWMTAEFLLNRGYLTRVVEDKSIVYELTDKGRNELGDVCVLDWTGV